MQFIFSTLIILFSLFFFTMPSASTLTGAMVHDRIVEELRYQNLSSRPAIDSARQFPFCSSDIVVESIFGSWKTVKISCPDTNWKIAVRTNINKNGILPQEIQRKKQFPSKVFIALTTSLDRGEVIKEVHLTYFKAVKNIGGGVFYEKQKIIGRTLKRALPVGTIIRARHLEPDWVIKKDQLVTIEHQIGNILINVQGVAQEAGQRGQRIWVNNINSGRKVLCWIKNDKKVTTNAKVY